MGVVSGAPDFEKVPHESVSKVCNDNHCYARALGSSCTCALLIVGNTCPLCTGCWSALHGLKRL